MAKKLIKTRFDTIIFDFDGVLADTFPFYLGYINKYLKNRGQEALNKKQVENLKMMRPMEIFGYLNVSILKIPFFSNSVRKEMSRHIGKISMDKSFKKVLFELKTLDIRMGIISSNSEQNVKKFVEFNEVNFFDFILAGGSVLRKHKLINSGIKKFKLNKDKTLKIGDEIRDINAARKVGIKVAVVNWGYNSEKFLMENDPDYLIKKPRDIFSIIKK